jgi:hypothetical protein
MTENKPPVQAYIVTATLPTPFSRGIPSRNSSVTSVVTTPHTFPSNLSSMSCATTSPTTVIAIPWLQERNPDQLLDRNDNYTDRLTSLRDSRPWARSVLWRIHRAAQRNVECLDFVRSIDLRNCFGFSNHTQGSRGKATDSPAQILPQKTFR